MTDLPQIYSVTQCAKCGHDSRDADVSFREGCSLGVDGEILRTASMSTATESGIIIRTCSLCGYKWLEEPFGAEKEE